MRGFSKLIELQNNIQKQGNYSEGDKIKPEDYVKAANKTFKNLNAKITDCPF